MTNVYNWYKISRFFFLKNFKTIAKIITLLIRLIFGCFIPYSADIGRGTVFGYGGIGVVIHTRSKIGENCIIDQGVTIGGKNLEKDVPKLGNNVYVGAGAKILGPIVIGDNVVIGANAVVNINVPNNSVVVGVPAKIIKRDIKIEEYRR